LAPESLTSPPGKRRMCVCFHSKPRISSFSLSSIFRNRHNRWAMGPSAPSGCESVEEWLQDRRARSATYRMMLRLGRARVWRCRVWVEYTW
jgi:hypothetical protein